MAAPVTLKPYLIQAYDRAVTKVPQRAGILKDTVRVVGPIMAETHHFPAIGKKVARTRQALQPIQASPSAKARPSCTMELKEDYEHIADHEVAQTNVSIMTTYGENSRMAVERACDQWIINAMDDINSDAFEAPIASAPSASKITKAFVGEAMSAFLNTGQSTSDMLTMLYPETQFEALIDIIEITSRDYSPRGFMSTGRVPMFLGIQLRGIELRDEGGLGAAGTKGFMYAKNGTGLAMSGLVKLRDISWRNDLNAWQVGARIMGASTVIMKNQVMELTYAAP